MVLSWKASGQLRNMAWSEEAGKCSRNLPNEEWKEDNLSQALPGLILFFVVLFQFVVFFVEAFWVVLVVCFVCISQSSVGHVKCGVESHIQARQRTLEEIITEPHLASVSV